MSTPTQKSPQIEANMNSMFGFDRRESITSNRCVPPPIGCGGPATEFSDELSAKEYTISGLCQRCQDKIFADPGDEGEQEAPACERPLRPPRYVAKPDEYVTDDYQMFSGQEEAVSHRYHKYVGKSGNTWLVADTEAAAENIYVTDSPRNDGKEGFGGALLSMPCVDGTVFPLKGGWHTNASALYADTGIDVRDKHRTFVVLSRARATTDDGTYRTIFRDIVYRDIEPTLGIYDRDKVLMALYPDANYVYSASKGGSSSGMTDEGRRRWEAAGRPQVFP